MEVKTVKTLDDLKKIAPVMLQLRSQYSEESLIEQIQEQQKNGYQLAYVEENCFVLCVTGFVVGKKLAWQKHVYVDDLVTSKEHQSKGAGTFLMEWIINFAKENGCQQLHLDSGVLRFPAHKFYLRQGFVINSHHFGIATLNVD